MVNWEQAGKRRVTKPKQTGAKVVHMERMGAHGGELRYLIRIGPAMVERMEAMVEDGDKENG